jgi:polysaccharide biosynthesis transport protein
VETPEYVRLLLRRWVWIAVLALGGAVAGYGYAAAQRPVYEAGAELFVSVRSSGSSATDLLQGATLTQRMTSYARVASTPLVTEPVIAQLRLDMTPAELASMIQAVSPIDTVLIVVTVTDSDPDQAADIADASARQLTKVIADLERTSSTTTTSPVRVTLTQPATIPSEPISPDVRRMVSLGLLVGVTLGIVGVVLREVTRRRPTAEHD